MSSKSILIILSYTVSKFAHAFFLRHSVVQKITCEEYTLDWPQSKVFLVTT